MNIQEYNSAAWDNEVEGGESIRTRASGFHITGFYEDYWSGNDRPLNAFMPSFIATRALKP